MKKLSLFSILLLTLLFSSCNKDEEKELNDDINGVIVTDASLLQELIASPENLSIANKHYFLSTYLQRDFMPVSEEDGRPMACVNTLTEEDNLTITDDIELKKQYVIKGDEIWIATYSEIRTPYDFVVEGVVRNGPKWEPGILVDVVSEFVVNGTTYRILAKSQKINRTD